MNPWVVALTPGSTLAVDYDHTVTSCGKEAFADGVEEIERGTLRRENLVYLG